MGGEVIGGKKIFGPNFCVPVPLTPTSVVTQNKGPDTEPHFSNPPLPPSAGIHVTPPPPRRAIFRLPWCAQGCGTHPYALEPRCTAEGGPFPRPVLAGAVQRAVAGAVAGAVGGGRATGFASGVRVWVAWRPQNGREGRDGSRGPGAPRGAAPGGGGCDLIKKQTNANQR